MAIVLEANELAKSYQLGAHAVRALDGVKLYRHQR